MSRTGGIEHEMMLREYIRELEEEGYRVIDLKAKTPDAIAIKDGKIIAIEVLRQYSKRAVDDKIHNYDMFDDVFIQVICREIKKSKRIPRRYNIDKLLEHLY